MQKDINRIVDLALSEDIAKRDITSNILIPKKHVSKAYIVLKERGIVCGLDIAQKVFKKLDRNVKFHAFHKDGDALPANTRIALVQGKTRALLAGERVALNFLSHLSGISTNTNRFVKRIYPFPAKIMDTRKTTPCLRRLDKYAVRCGGGVNHRVNLSEMVHIKDNHIAAYNLNGSISGAIKKLRRSVNKLIIVEVDNIQQFNEVLEAAPDIILLDNMSLSDMKKAVAINRKRRGKKKIFLEASGGINLSTVRSIAKIGIDRISIGKLTHSKKAIDVSMDMFSLKETK
ncbi:MAG: carboxylating nicotinate-nucleotide diphosphorylase [Candidatus Omnitrophota bacterium]